MQDLFQKYVEDLDKLREAFDSALIATAKELTTAMGIYARNSEAALSSFMEKVSARGVELEAAAAARFDQFRGLPANNSLAKVGEGQPSQTPANEDQLRIDTAAERAVAEGLQVEKDGERKSWPGRQMTLVKSDPAA
jgi:hypothetical protein